jgi:DNA polymerase-3 subunit gamma/tau
MPTLYRKYRPSLFADVTGQDTVVKTLENEIASDRLAHAYLFSGPRGVGKTTLARLFAKSVGCENRKKGTFEPCNKCSACTQINAGRHIDIVEIDAASQTGVDNVRENIIANANTLPTSLKHKIFIIDEVHMLSNSSFNALLKSLEEPPSHVIFILATTELHKLPATVISRCQRFVFKKIPYDKMLARLKKICSEEKIKVEKEVLERIARKSDGGLRDAESLLGQILSLDVKEITSDDVQMILPLSSTEKILEYLRNLTEGETGKAITLVNQLIEEGVDLNQFAYDLLETLRSILLLNYNADKSLVSADFSDESLKDLRKIGSKLGEKNLVQIMDITLKRKNEIKFSPLPQLPLELLAIEVSDIINFLDSAPTEKAPKTNEKEVVKKETPDETPKISAKKIEEKNPVSQIADTIKNAITQITDQDITTSLDTIKSKWSEVVEKASVSVPSLNFILAACTVCELKGNCLHLSVPYAIHKDRLDTVKNRQTIENCLQQIFSEKIRLSVSVVQEQPAPSADADMANLAAQFGGEVVG